MAYRIRSEAEKRPGWKWPAAGICAGAAVLCAAGLRPVWESVAAGEGLYDALARFVGGMILGPR